jgi:hypothetical protein
MQKDKANKMIIKQKGTIITAITLLLAVLASYYAFGHIGVYLIRKPHSVLLSIIANITAIILLPGFYLFLLLGGSAHAGINNIYEKLILALGSWFVWTSLVLCAVYLAKTIGKRFYPRSRIGASNNRLDGDRE